MHEWPVLVLRTDSLGAVATKGPVRAHFGSTIASGGIHADPFAQWEWNGASLTARNDRYGFLPIFYHVWEASIMLSPSLDALLREGAPAVIDATAVAVLLRAGCMVGDDTPFRDIRLLSPGGTLEWTPSALRVRGGIIVGKRQTMTRDAAINEYIDRFRTSVGRRPATGTSIVPLSGGRDSRHIFLELCASGRTPDVAMTIGGWGERSTPDADTARAVAERAGVRHLTLGRSVPRWIASGAMVRDTHYSALEHWGFRTLSEHLGALGGETTVYEGVAGDVLSTDLYKTPRKQQLFDQGRFEELAEEFMSDEGYLPNILPRTWYAEMNRAAAKHRIACELALHADAPNPLGSFLFYNRARRVTALLPASLYSPHATVWCPYLDADLWDFLSSLAPELVQGEGGPSLHQDAITRAYPRFADIPYSGKYMLRAPGRERDTMFAMSRDVARARPILVRKRFLAPRILRGLLDPRYDAEAAKLSLLVSYLTQLSAATEGKRRVRARAGRATKPTPRGMG